tara:strand:+ start:407 stop:781 length:375 start_codon:yes stop_codon:yes gene_type:complete
MNPNIIPIIKQINNYETRLENLNNWKEMFKNYNTLLNRKKILQSELENIDEILNTCEPLINNEVNITEIDDGTINILMQTIVSDNNQVDEKRKTWLILALENMVNAVIFVETRIVDVLKYLNSQ